MDDDDDDDDGSLNIYIMSRNYQKKREKRIMVGFLKNHLARRFHFCCWLSFAFKKMSPFPPQIDLKWK